MLLKMTANRKGRVDKPYGYPDAGRDASAWTRTVQSLVDKGLARWAEPYWGADHDIVHSSAYITDGGREFFVPPPAPKPEKTEFHSNVERLKHLKTLSTGTDADKKRARHLAWEWMTTNKFGKDEFLMFFQSWVAS